MRTLTVRSTHFFLIKGAGGWLLFDAGWAGSLGAFEAELKRTGILLNEIHWVMFSHNHPDHAGLVQEVVDASGAKLVIHPVQVPYLPEMEFFHKRKKLPFRPIHVRPGDIVLPLENRATLAEFGLTGEVIETPGHSPDSVSLVLTGGRAYTGDLTLPTLATENVRTVRESWLRVIAHPVREIYPSHGGVMVAKIIARMLDVGPL